MDNDWITIVSGLPRSGTSLMMQMLAAGGIPPLTDGIRAPDDDNPAGYFELERVKEMPADAAWLRAARGQAVKIVSLLLYDLPTDLPCRIVFMRRDLDEILASQKRMLAHRMVADPGPPDAVMRGHFENHLQKIRRWIEDRQIPCFECDYNHLLREPDPLLIRLAHFLGDRPAPEAMRAAIRADLYRQRAADRMPP